MIKKINFFMILVVSIGSLYFAILKDKEFVFVIKDISVILTISALYIIQKLFKIKINEGINFIYILFIFMAHFLGVTLNLYSQIYWYDKLVHFLSGIVTSFIAIYLLEKKQINKSIVFNILFIISFAMLAASCWEIFEYLASYYIGVDPQKVILTGVKDTMGDIIVALLGSILVSFSYYFEHKEKHNMLITKFEKLI